MEYYHPSEVHPHASAESMDAMLEQAPVAGLAVARVETVLEHGGLDYIELPFKGTKFIPHISIDRQIYAVIIVN